MKKLMNFRPVFILAVCLGLGILSAGFYFAGEILGFIITLSVVLILMTSYLIVILKEKVNVRLKLIFLLTFAVFYCLGAGLISLQINSFEKETLPNETLTIRGKVCEMLERENDKILVLKDIEILTDVENSIKHKVQIYVYNGAKVDLGDFITINAKLTERKLKSDGNSYYYLLADKIKFTASVESGDLKIEKGNKTIFQSINSRIKETLSVGLDEDEFPVTYAMLCGNSDLIDSDILSSYRQSGVAHIFAVSGLHIGFLVVILNFIFTKLRVNKYVKIVSIVGIALFYAGICNFSTSSIRAVIMTTIILISKLFGKKYDPLTSISFAFIILLFISPSYLYTAGFLLSFAVVLGIILLSSPISKIFKFLPKKLANSVGAVLSAQISAFPIMLALFNSASLISVLTNLVFIPLVCIIYSLTFICVILAIIFGASKVFLFVPNYVFKGVNFLITAFDYDVFIVSGFTFGVFIVTYYLTIFVLSGHFNLNKAVKIITAITLSSITIFGTIIKTSVDKNTDKLAVIHSNGISATAVYTKDETLLIVSDASGYFGDYKISVAMKSFNISNFDTVIFLADNSSLDINQKYSRLYNLVNANRVFVYNENLIALKHSFSTTEFFNCNLNQTEVLGEGISFVHSGKFLSLLIDDVKIIVSASFGKETFAYEKLNAFGYDFIVCFDYQTQIEGKYAPKTLLSYKSIGGYENAEDNGNIIYKIK